MAVDADETFIAEIFDIRLHHDRVGRFDRHLRVRVVYHFRCADDTGRPHGCSGT